MIEYDERTDLAVVENVLLWSMRAWAIGLRRGIPVEERIEEAFAKIGAPCAASQIYEFIWIIGHCSSRFVGVDCVCNPRISTDERCLLDIMALTQYGRSSDALVLLRSLVSGQAATAAALSAQRITTILTASGRFLSSDRVPEREPGMEIVRSFGDVIIARLLRRDVDNDMRSTRHDRRREPAHFLHHGASCDASPHEWHLSVTQ